MFTDIKALATLVTDRMISIVDANRKSFIETDDFESVFETCFDMIVSPQIPKWAYEKTYAETLNAPETALAFTVAKEMIAEERQIAVDNIVYHQSPMKYYGLKQSDFV